MKSVETERPGGNRGETECNQAAAWGIHEKESVAASFSHKAPPAVKPEIRLCPYARRGAS